MTSFEGVDPATVLSGRTDWMDADLADRVSEHPLECLDTEFPHFVGSVDSPDGFERPSDQHPVFYGCYDWHSAVHGHWSLVRQLRLFDDHPVASEVVERVEARLTAENVADEVAYFDEHETFEAPYGWAWFLRLAAELHLWESERATEWRGALAPLEDRVVELVASEYLPRDRPHRVGTHHNTAFALASFLDYARVVSDDALAAAVEDAARAYFLDDADYPVAYEPLGWDFLSPALAEADLMRRVLDAAEFADWVGGFLPAVTAPPRDDLLDPVDVEPEEDDGVALHLVGLNLSRAWCLAGVADALADHSDPGPFERPAERHAVQGLERAFTDDYAGAHWLTSFALYLTTRNEGGIAPD